MPNTLLSTCTCNGTYHNVTRHKCSALALDSNCSIVFHRTESFSPVPLVVAKSEAIKVLNGGKNNTMRCISWLDYAANGCDPV